MREREIIARRVVIHRERRGGTFVIINYNCLARSFVPLFLPRRGARAQSSRTVDAKVAGIDENVMVHFYSALLLLRASSPPSVCCIIQTLHTFEKQEYSTRRARVDA